MLLSRIAELTTQAATKVKCEYIQTFDELGVRIVELHESGLVAADYPTNARRHWLAARLNREYDSKYLLLNLSGTTFDTDDFASPVLDVTMNGPVVPLDVLIQLCTAVSRWLSQDSSRIIVAHGAEHNPEIVPFFFGCYLSWMGYCPHPKAGYLSVAARLGFTEADLLPSHRRYFQYFELLQRGFSPQPVVLQRFEIGGLEIDELCDAQDVTAEVRQEGRLITRCSALARDGADAIFELEDPVGGDVIITVWDTYICDGIDIGSGKPIARVCFNTGFACGDEVLHFPQQEIDDVLYAELMPDIAIKVFLGHGGSKAALAVERLALQFLLSAEGSQKPIDDAQLGEVELRTRLAPAVDIEDFFDEEFDICDADLIVNNARLKDVSNKVSMKLAPARDLEDFFRELDALAEV